MICPVTVAVPLQTVFRKSLHTVTVTVTLPLPDRY
jgi:hypothetical protein